RTEPNRTEPNRTEPNRTEIIHDLENNFNENKILQLKSLFPEAFCENQIDWEKLKLILGADNLAHQNERYQLNWAGKTDAYRTLQAPTFNTLSPCRAESVDFDGTRNLFIEAENLEALKILQKAYAGSVKMIYIDPPYNTGSDSFIYPDKFSETREEYAKRVGDKDDNYYLKRDGIFQGAWRKNSKDDGHYHSKWLSMMLPRLHLARTLLRDDGVIFISIDDNEQAQLKLLCNEVFGAENFVGCLILKTATDNNPGQIKTEHESILCYSKNKNLLKKWFSDHDGVQLMQDQYQKLKTKFKENIELIQVELRKWIKSNKEKLNGLTHYDNVDEKGVFHDGDVANTSFGGYEYDVIHPITKKVCKIPEKGYRFPLETMEEMIKNNNILFGENENILIKPKKRLDEAKDLLRSVIYEDGRSSTKKFEILMDRDIFPHPKSTTILARLINFTIENNDMVLDFFAGSGSTAEALMSLNAGKNLSAQYILIQLPEDLDISLAQATDKRKKTIRNAIKFLDSINKEHTIAEIAKERIRRAGAAVSGSLKDGQSVDTGFKVFKLSESNFKQWRQPENGADLEQQLRLAIDSVAEYAAPENMLYELMLRLGCKLTSPVAHENGVYWVTDEDTGKRIALLLEAADQTLIDEVIAAAPAKVVALDKWFDGNDALKSNTVLQMKDAGIVFECV
ncbi:site-specific DNA-methyltransferase, partial [Kingella oralis]|uniref:site-specific DNA-methyltransferase n=1 Tax=Kingella oralis TaxID=505 RepID=UPI002D7FF2F1